MLYRKQTTIFEFFLMFQALFFATNLQAGDHLLQEPAISDMAQISIRVQRAPMTGHENDLDMMGTPPLEEYLNNDLIIDDPEGYTVAIQIPIPEDLNNGLILESYAIFIQIPVTEDLNDDLIIDDPEGRRARVTITMVKSERENQGYLDPKLP